MENITEKGRLHHIYIFACVDPAAGQSGKRVYDNIVGYKTGVHLGGNVSAQRLLDFSGMSFSEQGRGLRMGLGLLPSTIAEASVRQVVIPKAAFEEVGL